MNEWAAGVTNDQNVAELKSMYMYNAYETEKIAVLTYALHDGDED